VHHASLTFPTEETASLEYWVSPLLMAIRLSPRIVFSFKVDKPIVAFHTIFGRLIFSWIKRIPICTIFCRSVYISCIFVALALGSGAHVRLGASW